MGSKHILVSLFFLSFFLLASSRTAPRLSDQFQAKVAMTMPYLPMVQGTLFYDYRNLRTRLDIHFHEQKSKQLSFYDRKIRYAVSGAGGDNQSCVATPLFEEIPPLGALPEEARYWYSETVQGSRCEVWKYHFEQINVDAAWYIHKSPYSRYASLLRAELKRGELFTRLEFTGYRAVVLPDWFFDPTQFGCSPLVPVRQFEVTGLVRDATTGRALPKAFVTLTGPRYSQMTVTRSNGFYHFREIPPHGNYTLSAVHVGYAPMSRQLNVTRDIPLGTLSDMSLPPLIQSHMQFRIMLQWGAEPQDLDLYVDTPWGCRTYYSQKRCATGRGSSLSTVVLDRDVRRGYGPETVTATLQHCPMGRFRVYVNYRSSTGTWRQSDARVTFQSHKGTLTAYVRNAREGDGEGAASDAVSDSASALAFEPAESEAPLVSEAPLELLSVPAEEEEEAVAEGPLDELVAPVESEEEEPKEAITRNRNQRNYWYAFDVVLSATGLRVDPVQRLLHSAPR
eukprot:gnl/Trimastix_PCT/3075.p1 GENE.gnl/Trimastix_PCT/3075~~gnl/Trimastix_PCT/3075.p1  ORF type:complete len:508 (+),score=102.16 gnl/Trimastix_PCT/3075:48-1571(+)